jgi:hypothetical protein
MIRIAKLEALQFFKYKILKGHHHERSIKPISTVEDEIN